MIIVNLDDLTPTNVNLISLALVTGELTTTETMTMEEGN